MWVLWAAAAMLAAGSIVAAAQLVGPDVRTLSTDEACEPLLMPSPPSLSLQQQSMRSMRARGGAPLTGVVVDAPPKQFKAPQLHTFI